MPNQKPPSDRALVFAVELRAGGSTWESIAKRLHRSPETLRKWPMQYPDRWKAAESEAERRVAAGAEGESVLCLRQLLRSKDEKIIWHAAKSLLGLRLDLLRINLRAIALNNGNHTSDAARLLVSLLETQSDEHLERMVSAELERTATAVPLPPGTPPASAA